MPGMWLGRLWLGSLALAALGCSQAARGRDSLGVGSAALLPAPQKLTASDGGEIDLFGRSVAVFGDTALVGATNRNAAYVYTRSGTTWTQQQILTGGGKAVALF